MEAASDSSSPFSPESNFRDLDDVYLQTQARIWLGEVLHTRFDENVNMSDLLADGELLFEVSGIVWRMLLTRYKELRHIEAFKYEPFASRKSSRSYMPYSNVDSFLKICKIMGLTGIDLFSPSDVVEKRSTRKVCMCIRSLSKKARSKQLNVPDFDMVTYTAAVAMPTDNVECIRRSLEQSQHRFLRNASPNSDQVLLENLMKINSVAASNGKFDTCLEESVDDSDCNFVTQPDGSSITCSYETPSQINSNLMDSPVVSSVVEKHALARHFSPSENHAHQFESLFLDESSGSCSLLPGEDDYQQDSFSPSSCVDSSICLSGRTGPAKTFRHSYETGAPYFCDLDLQNDVLEGFMGCSTQERSDVNDQLPISDIIFKETGTGNPIQFDGNDGCFREDRSPSSHGSNSTPRTIESGFRSKLYGINDVEVSSAAEIKPVSDVVLNLDFDDQLDARFYSKVSSPEFQDHRSRLINNESQNMFMYKTPVHHATSVIERPPTGMEVINAGFSTKPFVPCSDAQSLTINNSDYDVSYYERTCISVESKVEYDEGKWSPTESNALKDVHCNQCLELLSSQSYSLFDFHPWDQKGKCAVDTTTNENYGNNGHRTPQSVSQEDLPVESASCYPAKPTADKLVQDIKSDVINSDKGALNATMFESDQPNNHSQSKLKCADEDSASQHWHRMIQHNSDQNQHILYTASKDYPLAQQDAVYPPTTIEPILDEDSSSTTDYPENLGCQSPQVSNEHKNESCCARNICDTQSPNNQRHEEVEIVAVENSDRTDDPSAAKHKPYGRLLLKSVVRGTVVFGALFLFLQFRKSSREESGESNMQLGKVKDGNGVKLSRQKQLKESKVNGVYPANKLRF